MTKAKKARRASRPLYLIHTDICSPGEQISRFEIFYFIDDCSKRLSIYFLKSNSSLKMYKTYVERQTGFLTLRFDNVNSSTKISNVSCVKRALSDITISIYSPQQNDLTERCNRIVVEKGCCLLIDANFPKRARGLLNDDI